MSAELLGLLVGFGVVVGTRVLDYMLPKGWHFKFLDRYAEPTEEPQPAPDKEESP